MNINQEEKERQASPGKVMTHKCLASCRKVVAEIEQAKANLLRELRGTFQVPEKLFQLAFGEAEALAWQTEFPLLVLPALAAEKLRTVAAWQARQQLMWKQKPALAMSN